MKDRIGNQFRSQTIPEGGSGGRASVEGKDEVGNLVNEGVLVSDLQSRHPPVLHVWVTAVRDVNVLPATQLTFIAIVEVLQPVQVMKIPRSRGPFAVYLQREERLVASRVTRRFEESHRAI